MVSTLVTAESVSWSLGPFVEFTDVNYSTKAALRLSRHIFFDDCEETHSFNTLFAFYAYWGSSYHMDPLD